MAKTGKKQGTADRNHQRTFFGSTPLPPYPQPMLPVVPNLTAVPKGLFMRTTVYVPLPYHQYIRSSIHSKDRVIVSIFNHFFRAVAEGKIEWDPDELYPPLEGKEV